MMVSNIPKTGEIYKHFKDKLYQIVTVATHSETNELMVVYQALYGDFKTYVRPLEMFISEVDHDKYPDVKQQYRFERKVSQESLVNAPEDVQAPINDQDKLAQKDSLAEQPAVENLAEQPSEVNLLLLKFLDAETYTGKLEVLTTNKNHMTDRIINDMAVALDCAVDEGPIDKRIQELISCLEAKRRFEDRRMR